MHFCTVQTLAILMTEISSFLWFLCATKKRQNKSSHLCLILLNAINDLSNSTYIITKQENKTSRVDKYSRSRGCPKVWLHTTGPWQLCNQIIKIPTFKEILHLGHYADIHPNFNYCLVWSSHACPCGNLHLYMLGQPLWKTCHQASAEIHPLLVWRLWYLLGLNLEIEKRDSKRFSVKTRLVKTV